MYSFIQSNIGILINAIGSLMIVISIGKFPKEFGGSTTGDDGKEYHFAYVTHPKLLKIGLLAMVVGFLLQINWNFKPAQLALAVILTNLPS